ncbi:MAG: DUF493 domain-containing protein [Methylococcales bacterium]
MNEEETLFEFPCQFPIKAMGKNISEFDSIVVSIVRNHAGDIQEDAIKVRPSKGDKFLAVTVTIEAQSKQQLDAIYQDLNDSPAVIMVL